MPQSLLWIFSHWFDSMKTQFYENQLLWTINSMNVRFYELSILWTLNSMNHPFYENVGYENSILCKWVYETSILWKYYGKNLQGEVTSGYEFSREVSDSAKM